MHIHNTCTYQNLPLYILHIYFSLTHTTQTYLRNSAKKRVAGFTTRHIHTTTYIHTTTWYSKDVSRDDWKVVSEGSYLGALRCLPLLFPLSFLPSLFSAPQANWNFDSCPTWKTLSWIRMILCVEKNPQNSCFRRNPHG